MSRKRLSPWQLGLVQAFSTAAPPAAVVFDAVGYWWGAGMYALTAGLALYLWGADGWRIKANEDSPWETLDDIAHRIHLRGPIRRYLCYRADLSFGMTRDEARS
jgi:hypothetical protein